ncbi:MAG: hypothetical protein ACYCW6_15465 [Candidatus Xenobia bacterium]
MSPGELLDRLTILEIKSARLRDPAHLVRVRNELAELRGERARIGESPALAMLLRELKSLNESRWDVENELRFLEAQNDFGEPFINVARAHYHTNDRRHAVINRINQLLAAPEVPWEFKAPGYDLANYGP